MEKQGIDKRLNRLNTFAKSKAKQSSRLIDEMRMADKAFSNCSNIRGFQTSHQMANLSLIKKLGGAK